MQATQLLNQSVIKLKIEGDERIIQIDDPHKT